MSIAIISSGGDCAGMNPAIKAFVDYCYHNGEKPYFIYDGLEGLIDGNIRVATHDDVAGIIHLGGTIIRSSRSKRFFEYKQREKAFNNLKKRGIDKLIVLGGDGSFRAMNQFYQDFKINFIGIPSTIDNDIFGTDYCLGVDTCLNVIRSSIDSIRDTSSSFKRASVVETMGRECGYLALISALTCGAEVCIIPELEYDLESLGKRLKREIKEGRKYIICVVSEGTKATKKVVKWLEKDVGIETRASILGYIQRGGNPTTRDRLMAYQFVNFALEKICNEKSHHIIVYKDDEFKFKRVEYISSQKAGIEKIFLKLGKRLVK